MEMQDFKIGMEVMIKHDITETHERFDSCEEMEEMRGKVFTVDSFSVSREHVMVRGYTWDPGDLMLYEHKPPKPKIFHFDESKL